MCKETEGPFPPPFEQTPDGIDIIPLDELCNTKPIRKYDENEFELDFVDAEDYDPEDADPEFW